MFVDLATAAIRPPMYILIGLPGLGKTRRARELELARRALRLTVTPDARLLTDVVHPDHLLTTGSQHGEPAELAAVDSKGMALECDLARTMPIAVCPWGGDKTRVLTAPASAATCLLAAYEGELNHRGLLRHDVVVDVRERIRRLVGSVFICS